MLTKRQLENALNEAGHGLGVFIKYVLRDGLTTREEIQMCAISNGEAAEIEEKFYAAAILHRLAHGLETRGHTQEKEQ